MKTIKCGTHLSTQPPYIILTLIIHLTPSDLKNFGQLSSPRDKYSLNLEKERPVCGEKRHIATSKY